MRTRSERRGNQTGQLVDSRFLTQHNFPNAQAFVGLRKACSLRHGLALCWKAASNLTLRQAKRMPKRLGKMRNCFGSIPNAAVSLIKPARRFMKDGISDAKHRFQC
jgi:hypothetical protein